MDTFDELSTKLEKYKKEVADTTSDAFIELVDQFCEEVVNNIEDTFAVITKKTTCERTKKPCLLYEVNEIVPKILRDDWDIEPEHEKFQVIKERLETAVSQLFPMVDCAVERESDEDPHYLIIKLYRKDE